MALKDWVHLLASSAVGLTDDADTVCLLILRKRSLCFLSSSGVLMLMTCLGLGITILWDFSGSMLVQETMLDDSALTVDDVDDWGWRVSWKETLALSVVKVTFGVAFLSAVVFLASPPYDLVLRMESPSFLASVVSVPTPAPIFVDSEDDEDPRTSTVTSLRVCTLNAWPASDCLSVRLNDCTSWWDSRWWGTVSCSAVVRLSSNGIHDLQQQQDLMNDTKKLSLEVVLFLLDDDGDSSPWVWRPLMPSSWDTVSWGSINLWSVLTAIVGVILLPSGTTSEDTAIDDDAGELRHRQHPAVLNEIWTLCYQWWVMTMTTTTFLFQCYIRSWWWCFGAVDVDLAGHESSFS